MQFMFLRRVHLFFGIFALVFLGAGCSRVQPLPSSSGPSMEDVVSSLATLSPSASPSPSSAINEEESFSMPVQGFFDAITKKPFGIFIDSKTSPVQPERFHGYHTGADAEVSAGSPVVAMADGMVVRSGFVSGYGGLIVLEHRIDGKRMLSLYGHMNIASLPKVGTALKSGQRIGETGKGFSHDTDGERPHLHFSVYVGSGITVAGYVQAKGALSSWEDPVLFLKDHNAKSSWAAVVTN